MLGLYVVSVLVGIYLVRETEASLEIVKNTTKTILHISTTICYLIDVWISYLFKVSNIDLSSSPWILKLLLLLDSTIQF